MIDLEKLSEALDYQTCGGANFGGYKAGKDYDTHEIIFKAARAYLQMQHTMPEDRKKALEDFKYNRPRINSDGTVTFGFVKITTFEVITSVLQSPSVASEVIEQGAAALEEINQEIMDNLNKKNDDVVSLIRISTIAGEALSLLAPFRKDA